MTVSNLQPPGRLGQRPPPPFSSRGDVPARGREFSNDGGAEGARAGHGGAEEKTLKKCEHSELNDAS